MPLVTPFDASFWSTKERSSQPQKSKQEIYNEGLWGSPTVEKRWHTDATGGVTQEWYSSVTGNTYPSPEAARADEAAFRSNPQQWSEARQWAPSTGRQEPVQNPNIQAEPPEYVTDIRSRNYTGANAAPTLNRDALANTKTAPPPGFTNELPTRASSSQSRRAPTTPSTPNPVTDVFGPMGGSAATGAGAPPAPSINDGGAAPGAPAPVIDRTRINDILGGLQGYANDIVELGRDNTGLSAAEAQLNKAHELAKIRARDELAANQAGALGAARSARNRGDRALLERQAIGEQAYLGSQSQRQQQAADTQLGLDLAILRAQEEDSDRKFRLDALSRASELGLNTAALEVQMENIDLDSATNWINNEFQQLALDKQLDQALVEALMVRDTAQMQALLGYARDMAAIQYQYDQLSVEDQNEADRLLMQKYGIDQNKAVALKQIKEQGKFRWDNVLAGLAGGAGSGLTGGIFNLIGGGGGGGAQQQPVGPVYDGSLAT